MIISIVRDVERTEIKTVADSLLRGGIHRVEVSLSDEEKGFASLYKLCQNYRDEMEIGVGTVTSIEQADKAIEIGAKYIITPGWDKTLVEACLQKGYRVIPGVFTPGEIMQAQMIGIHQVKLFPASSLGEQYIRNIKGPFPKVSIMGVGGITLKNVRDYQDAGCDSFAIGSDLVPRGATKRDQDHIEKRAKAYERALKGEAE
ncbi:bifunctional 4-hydroxy-2-oxoglutarate aldolase/2-dehydro-3-deoxy-phosphogluconate aldolase [Anaerobacillus sp. 1_MG-2023]|uniref:bifunctional 4-hydroxy-2-oxoglutarate aldolase/2-dehydro-3-deoxy-phosphogluconate aldolase n=1 Tax=Anaerobacillus sp. 1_MG-2023 TaxID=3062655 RepID=UPI0026E43774|nr:bifunctional 4-hydroxy-2-oxoglutarate aldolase/2-dehydro-3-deoxy-phosphogluconate aldolase [Anaerobacillus sp. 1_MG-2023]MDO6657416.1 bifunctional 4-hydroxy-2-oxoglutarate aldolase/2-dehydro-3-deoxy-phosphogluconate aldolase [Anaerobacillus sp. 1_MG-2023]